MRSAAPVVRVLTSLLLMATTAAGGWVAACSHPAMVRAHLVAAHQMMHGAMMHGAMMHGAMHHHAPARPPAPVPPDDWAECPAMAMSGASWFGASSAAALDLSIDPALGSGDAYPPALEVRDRLPNDLPSDPPRA